MATRRYGVFTLPQVCRKIPEKQGQTIHSPVNNPTNILSPYSNDVVEAISKSQLAKGRLPRSASFQGVWRAVNSEAAENRRPLKQAPSLIFARQHRKYQHPVPFSPSVPSLSPSPTINRLWGTYAQTVPPPVPGSPPNPSQDEPLGRQPVGLSRRRALEAGELSPDPFGLANALLTSQLTAP